ncbi:MAG: murein biosynthesis integral membrane protein MurJ [Thermodesulfobacteriota bacterium]
MDRGEGREDGLGGASSSSSRRDITGAASVVGSATLLSRILGYVRDAVIAALFGAGFETDIFFVAYRIPNFFRRLVGEGALTASIVPVFTEEIGADSSLSMERRAALAAKFFTLFAIIFLVITLLGILFAPQLVDLMAPGFASTVEKHGLTVSMTRWMFPFLFFIGLFAVAMALLNSLKHFMAPALAPALFNITIIASVILLSALLSNPLYALAIGVVIGGAAQALFQLPYLKRFGVSPRLTWDLRDGALGRVLLLMGPYALGVGVYQINIFITQRFASGLAEGSISYLYYADRLVQLPFGVFGVALATAALPSMSRHAMEGEWSAFREAFSFSIRIVNFIIIPSMVGLVVLGIPIISLLFQRGLFDEQAVNGTAIALYFYSAGLVAFASTKIAASAFYSLKDTKTPVIAAVASVAVNLILCLLLMKPLRHGGLALATSLASFMNLLILIAVLRRRMGGVGGGEIVRSAVKVSIASIIMGIGAYGVYTAGGWYGDSSLWKATVLTAALLSGACIYVISAYLLRVYEMRFLSGIVMEKIGKIRGIKDGNDKGEKMR